MKLYTYTQARERLAAVLDEAKKEEVVIRRRNGDQFTITPRRPAKSPFDVPSIRTRATTGDILEVLRESRERGPGREDAR
jgi:antitoxin Phd